MKKIEKQTRKEEIKPGLILSPLLHAEPHDNYALSTKPDLKQEVHTYILWVPPFTLTLTDFTFAFHILLDRLWEWLTLFPK